MPSTLPRTAGRSLGRYAARIVLALTATAGLLVVGQSPAAACSCAIADLADYVDRADLVAVGAIGGPAGEGSSGGGSDGREPGGLAGTVEYEVLITEVYKGEDVPAVVTVESAAYGASCGWESIDHDRPYVVFVSRKATDDRAADDRAAGGTYWGSLCDGTRPATTGLTERVAALTGPARAPEPGAPAPQDPDTPWVLGGLAGAVAVTGLAWLRRVLRRGPR